MKLIKGGKKVKEETVKFKDGKKIGERTRLSNSNEAVSVFMKKTENVYDKDVVKTSKVWDFFQQARLEQAPLLLKVAEKLKGGLQGVGIPEDVLEYCHSFAANHVAAKAMMLSLVKIPYAGIEQAKAVELQREISKIPGELSSSKRKEVVRDIKSIVNQKYNLAYDGLRSMARMVTARWVDTPWDRVTVLMSLCYSDINGNPIENAGYKLRSNIIEKLLPEEFALWVIEMGRLFRHWQYCDKVAIYPRDIWRPFETNETYGLHKCAIIKDGHIYGFCGDLSASGRWTAAKDESGRWYLWQPVQDYIENIIPEARYITVPLDGVQVEFKDELEKEFQEGTPVVFNNRRQVTNGDVSLRTYRRDDDWESIIVKGKKFFAKKEFYAKNNIGAVAQLVLSNYTDAAEKPCVGGFMVISNPMHTDQDFGDFPPELGSNAWKRAHGWEEKEEETPTGKPGGLRSHIVKKEVV